MKTYNWEGVNPDGYFLDKLEPIPSALPSFQKLFQVSATALSIDRKSGSAGMPRPISYAVFCLKKKKKKKNKIKHTKDPDKIHPPYSLHIHIQDSLRTHPCWRTNQQQYTN